MTNENNEAQEEKEQHETRPDDATLQERRDLGSAEFNAMTFTPPGGVPMTLDEHERHYRNIKKTGENS